MGDGFERRLKGHFASVLCCSAFEETPALASGGEDGRVIIFDLRANEPSQVFYSFEGLPVSSLCFIPGKENIIFSAAGASVYHFDLRLGGSAKELTKYVLNADDVNQLSINRKGTYLASSDDNGEIKILDLQNRKLFKTLKGGHTNICTSVQFHPQRPWEVVTGGLDSRIIKWDFSRGRPLSVLAAGVANDATDQMFNPPFVHALACLEKETSGEAGRIIAAACGDSTVEVYDLNFQANRRNILSKRCRFDIDKGGHTAPVSHVTFEHFEAGGKKMILSGGNDCKIKLWDWTDEQEPMKLTINHKRKINWLATRTGFTENLIVADTSKFLSIYNVRI